MSKYHDEFWNKDGSAKKCYVCDSTNIKTIDTAFIDGYWSDTCEKEERCADCGELLAYWTYGHYVPDWLMTDEDQLRSERNDNH